MIIVKVWAGLGNQMFIYAFYRALQHAGKEVKLDTSSYKFIRPHGEGYLLPEIFPNLKQSIATKEECKRLANYQSDVFHRFLRKYRVNKKSFFSQSQKCNDIGYCPELFDMDEVYFEGYFQSEKYFMDMRNELLHEFTFKVPQIYPNKFLSLIREHNSVSIHVRRGDYLKKGYKRKLVSETRYYENAIEYIEDRIKYPYYFVFSDDIEWCKEYFKNFKGEFYFIDDQPRAYLDMYLMTECHHNIIADSTFSWWGGWLNCHKDKLVLCPKDWPFIVNVKKTDIIPKDWVQIELD